MKNRMMAMVILACLFTMIALPAMAANKTATSTAKIKFIAGELEFDADINGKLTGMDIDFGTKALLTGEQTYKPTTAKAYVLTIWDQRAVVGNWKVQVKLDNFKTADEPVNEFTGKITLPGAPTYGSSSNSSTWVDPKITEKLEISAADEDVVGAQAGLKHGAFYTKWNACTPVLSIDATNAAKLVIGKQYTAVLTWTLSDV